MLVVGSGPAGLAAAIAAARSGVAVTLVELAKRVIDASGDADVAERAGVPTRNMGCCAVLGQGRE